MRQRQLTKLEDELLGQSTSWIDDYLSDHDLHEAVSQVA